MTVAIDGLAQRLLRDQPAEHERDAHDRGRDEEDDVQRVGERRDLRVAGGDLRASRPEKIAPRIAVPSEPPIERNSVDPDVATPSMS